MEFSDFLHLVNPTLGLVIVTITDQRTVEIAFSSEGHW